MEMLNVTYGKGCEVRHSSNFLQVMIQASVYINFSLPSEQILRQTKSHY